MQLAKTEASEDDNEWKAVCEGDGKLFSSHSKPKKVEQHDETANAEYDRLDEGTSYPRREEDQEKSEGEDDNNEEDGDDEEDDEEELPSPWISTI